MSPAHTLAWHDIEADPAGWDEKVIAAASSLFHLSAVLSAHQYGAARRRGIVAMHGTQIVAAIGGLHTPDDRFHTLSFVPPDAKHPKALFAEVTGWLGANGVSSLEIGSFEQGVEGHDTGNAGRVTDRLEFPWDLTCGTPDCFSGIRSNHKRKLKKLAASGAVCRPVTGNPAWTLTRLRAHWEARKGHGTGLIKFFRAWRYHAALHKHLGRAGIGRLYGLYSKSGELLCISYMLEHADTAFYMLGASAPEGYRVGASIMLFTELAGQYTGQGMHTLNLGGVPLAAADEAHEEHGVYRFKCGFGIRPVPRKSLHIPL